MDGKTKGVGIGWTKRCSLFANFKTLFTDWLRQSASLGTRQTIQVMRWPTSHGRPRSINQRKLLPYRAAFYGPMLRRYTLKLASVRLRGMILVTFWSVNLHSLYDHGGERRD